jgi:ribosomal protein S18 acetylase RimI-like enzyme
MSGFFDKLKRANELLAQKGFLGFFEKIIHYIHYNLRDKWRFIYFELDLTSNPYSLPDIGESIMVRRAQSVDISKIKNDLYPYMEDKQEFDKRYIDRIGEGNFNCFIAEVDNNVVNYFIVFNEATDSPLMQTPLDKRKVTEKDAYMSSTFTIPEARGKWVVPYVILSIIDYFQKETNATRALLLVHEDTPGAVGFYSRLGFEVIDDAYPNGLLSRFLKSL